MSSDGRGSSAGGRKQAGASTNSWGRRDRDEEPAQTTGGATPGGTHDASRDRDWRVQLPKDMARYRDLDALMLVLDEAIGGESEGLGPPTAVSCVAAMNHLKRLWQSRKRGAGAPEAERERERAYRGLFLHFLDRAEPSIPRLRLKHLSVLLNALISQRWIAEARRRHTSGLCQQAIKQVLSEITAATDGAVVASRGAAVPLALGRDSARGRGDASSTVLEGGAAGYGDRGAAGDGTEVSQVAPPHGLSKDYDSRGFDVAVSE